MGDAEQGANAGNPSGAAEFDNPTQALVYDLTQSCVIDPGCFVETIVREIRSLRTRRILDLGCGTGLQALPILECLNAIDYTGVDHSPAMVAIFQRKLDERQGRGIRTQLCAGVDLRKRTSIVGLEPLKGGAVLVSQFLQYLPVEPSPEMLAKSEMLQCLVALAGSGGRVFIIEDVMDEPESSHAPLSSQWDRAVVSRYRENLDQLRSSLDQVAPRYLDVIGKLIERPALMSTMRERRRRTRGETILPLSAWQKLLGDLGRPFRMIPHRDLANFYLTVIEC